MAVDAFLKLDGITGESQDEKHKGEIDLLDVTFHMSNPEGAGYGGGIGAGKVDFNHISISKRIDFATCNLMGVCASLKHIPKGVITIRKAGGDKPVDYMIITIEEVGVVGYAPSGLASGDGTEHLDLTFSKFKMQYTSQSEKGAKDKTVDFGWDVKANKQISGAAG
jgi:type VI secretion system secreted protein Hcp